MNVSGGPRRALVEEIRVSGSAGQDDRLPEEIKRLPSLQVRRTIGAAGLI
jgi:hypothetical protein